MARPKSEDKRNAIRAAAITLFVERGIWSTPTSAISKAAGVAEGTLFTYFSTKEVLVNELYRMLKQELAEALLADFPKTAELRGQFQYIWNGYIHWAERHPAKLKVMAQLQVSDQITAESKAIGYAPFAEIERLAHDSITRKQIHAYPVSFIAAVFSSMAETTMAAMAQNKNAEMDYCAAGFEVFWRGIVR